MENNEASYYIIIPGPVRFDKKLSAYSKLLYGEIASKCNLRGYCWATNQFFADLFNCNVRSVQRYFKELEDAGHITVELNKNIEGTERKIFLNSLTKDATKLSSEGMTKPSPPPCDKPVTPPHDKKVTHTNNNTLNNKISLFSNENKGATVKKLKVEKPKTLFQRFIAVYSDWFKNRNEGVPPKIDGGQGNAGKALIAYFQQIVKARADLEKTELAGEDLEKKLLEAWELVLNSWHLLDNFNQNKTRLVDINSNIQNIIKSIKDANRGNKQGTRGGKIDGGGISSMFDAINSKYGQTGTN